MYSQTKNGVSAQEDAWRVHALKVQDSASTRLTLAKVQATEGRTPSPGLARMSQAGWAIIVDPPKYSAAASCMSTHSV